MILTSSQKSLFMIHVQLGRVRLVRPWCHGGTANLVQIPYRRCRSTSHSGNFTGMKMSGIQDCECLLTVHMAMHGKLECAMSRFVKP